MKIPLPKSYFRFLIVALLFVGQFAIGQTTVFSENMGTSTASTTTIPSTTFQNNGTLTYSGTADTRTSIASSGYAGASGVRNVFITNTNGTNFQIAGINSAGYSSLSLSFGIYKSVVGSTGADLKVEVSTDGSTYTALAFPALPTGAGTATWHYTTATGIIPSTSNLRIRFIQSGTATQYRIDDVKLTGTTGPAALTAIPTSLTGMTYAAGSGPSNVKNFVLTGANLSGTQNVTVLPGDNWEVSTNQTTWFTFDSPLYLNNYSGASTTIFVRLISGLTTATTYNDIIAIEGYGVTPGPEVSVSGSVTAQVAPVVTSATVTGTVGTPINYQILATGNPTGYTFVSGALPTGLSFDTVSGIISGTPTAVGNFPIVVKATNNAGTSTEATITLTIAQATQTITFTAPASAVYGSSNFALTATASSGLGISYTSSDTSVATVSGNEVAIIGVGTTQITATQVGNANYAAAASITQPFTVTAKSISVTGVTANNKVEDGNTTASLSGTATLVGVIGADLADVNLSGVPTATFATSAVGTGIAVTVNGYILTGAKANNYLLIQPTGLTANIYVLGTPEATAATEIGSTSFVANWNAVTDASNYRLDVFTGTTSVPSTTTTETFTTIGGDPASSYLTRTWTGDGGIQWTANKARTDRTIVVGNPAITLSDESGANLESSAIPNGVTSISFDTKQAFAGSGGILTIKILSGPTFSTVTNVGTYAYTTTASTYNSPAITAITGDYKIVIENNTNVRAIIDNLKFTSAGSTATSYVPGYENLSVGDVTSHLVSGLNPSTQYYYRVRAILGTYTSPNSNVISISTVATDTDVTWNGTQWSNEVGPTAATNAFIDGAYSTETSGLFTAKSLTIRVGGSLNVASGATITVIEGLNNTLTAAAVVFENNANLIQGGTSNDNSGEITVKRNSSALKRQDYTMWSSPTTGEQTLLDFSLATLPNRFYTYNTTTNQYNAVLNTTNSTSPATTSFDVAKGYLIRMPNGHPTSPTIWEGIFKGLPNNGNISYSLENDGIGKRFNAVGNPYPSPIDAFAFVDNAANFSSITGTLYFWRKTNNAESPSYSSWTRAGFVSNGEAQNVNPNGVIQTGQGFIVEGTGNGTAVQFSNAMRVNNHANQFFKTNNTVEYNRIWLNATNADGLFSQTLVGYITDSSDDLDRADGKYMNDGPIALTSIINDTPYAIQARSLPFQATDLVPLQFKATDAGTYTISIDHVDGLFETDQAIYLRDALTGAEQDLKEGAYTFASEAGTFADRFNLAYTNLLSVSNSVLDANSIVVFKNDAQSFTINSGNATMQTVKVFDIRGRLLATQNNINAIQTTIAAGQANEVLLIQVTSVDGITVTKKVVR